jgi:hypothetical protein
MLAFYFIDIAIIFSYLHHSQPTLFENEYSLRNYLLYIHFTHF